MTDPVQVVAGEFRGLMRRFAELGYVDGTWEHQEAVRFVAALKAAGALMPVEAGTCGGCGARITDPDDVRAGQHIVEGPQTTSTHYVLGPDEDLVAQQWPDDPRMPCGPVYPDSEVTKYELGKALALLQEALSVLGRLVEDISATQRLIEPYVRTESTLFVAYHRCRDHRSTVNRLAEKIEKALQ